MSKLRRGTAVERVMLYSLQAVPPDIKRFTCSSVALSVLCYEQETVNDTLVYHSIKSRVACVCWSSLSSGC